MPFMKSVSINAIQQRIRNAHPRTRKAQLNTVLGLGIRGGGMVISLLLVPITLDYLSTDTYGTWLTISSAVAMLAFFDIGVGNGLRNKLSEAIALQDSLLARSYVSTAYAVFGIIQLAIVGFFLLVVRYVPWSRVFNTSIDTTQLQTVVLLTVVAIAVKLVLDILSYVLFALQEPSWVGFMSLVSNVIILAGTYALTRSTTGSLLYLAAITVVTPIAVVLIGGAILYRHRLKAYRPAFRLVNFTHAGSLLSLGYKFFVIQMAVLVVFYTDNLIIAQLFGPAEVTTYNVAFKYFNAANVLFVIAITPYWSAFTEAAIKNDTSWMVQTYRYLQKLWVGLVAVVLLMSIVAGPVYSLWVGNRVMVPHLLNFCMGLSVIVACWNNVTVAVINGTGKVHLQLYCSLIAALINVPLAILFGKTFQLGSAGVILATSVSLLLGAVSGAIQARKLVVGKAEGIWDQ